MMKRLIALLLCIPLCLMTAATADEVDLLDLGDFTIAVKAEDMCNYCERSNDELLLQLKPASTENYLLTANMTIGWTMAELRRQIQPGFAAFMAANALELLSGSLEEIGLTVTNKQVMETIDGEPALYMYTLIAAEVDLSIYGINSRRTVYQEYYYMDVPGEGSYIFCLTADSTGDMDILREYIPDIELW